MSESEHKDAMEVSDASPEQSDTSMLFAELNVDEVVKERDEFKDIALRVQADFENYRKRAASQLTDEVDRA